MNMPEVADRFLSRGVSLNPPATSRDFSAFLSWLKGEVDPDFLELYACFDGFEADDFDTASEISLWPLAKIVQIGSNIRRGTRVPFADFSFGLKVYSVDCADAKSEIRSIFEDVFVSGSFGSFVEDVGFGRMDV